MSDDKKTSKTKTQPRRKSEPKFELPPVKCTKNTRLSKAWKIWAINRAARGANVAGLTALLAYTTEFGGQAWRASSKLLGGPEKN